MTTHFHPKFENFEKELNNAFVLDKNSIVFRFLITQFVSTVVENTGISILDTYKQFKRDSLQTNAKKIIGRVLDELYFLHLDIPSTFTLTNSGIKQVLEYVDKEIDNKIEKQFSLYKGETLLTTLVLLSSALSKITINLGAGKIPRELDAIDSLINIFNSLTQYIAFDPRVYLGELKSTLEHIINGLLLTEDRIFSKNISEKQVDLADLCYLFDLYFAKITIDYYRDILPFVTTAERNTISFSGDLGISFPDRIFNNFSRYLVETRDEEVKIGDKKIQLIMDYLKKVKGVSPDIVYNYLKQDDQSRGLKLESNYVSICEKNMIVCDLSANQNISLEEAKMIIDNLTLNNSAFYGNRPSNIVIGEPNMRFFRSPLLHFKSFEILSTYSLFESARYFAYRILRTEILNKNNGKKWTKLIKDNFDELLLPELKNLAQYFDKNCKVNYYLNQSKVPGIKELVKRKKLKEELDLVFLFNGTLFIYDLKNYGLARNIKQCKRVIETQIYNEFAKLNKLKNQILINKELFEAEFGSFDSVEIGIVTVNTTPYRYFKNGRVFSLNELNKDRAYLIS